MLKNIPIYISNICGWKSTRHR